MEICPRTWCFLPRCFLVPCILFLCAACPDKALEEECQRAADAHKNAAINHVDVRGEFADPVFDAIFQAEAKARDSDDPACRSVVRFANAVRTGQAAAKTRVMREDADAAREKSRARASCRSACEESDPDEHTCAIKCGCIPVAGKGSAEADCFESGSGSCAGGCKAAFAKRPKCIDDCD